MYFPNYMGSPNLGPLVSWNRLRWIKFVPDSSERSFPTSNKSFSFQIRSSMPPTRHLPPSLTATVSTFFQGAIFSSLKAEEAPGSLKSIKNAKEKTWKSKRLYFERWAERAAQGHGAWARLRGFWRFFLFERGRESVIWNFKWLTEWIRFFFEHFAGSSSFFLSRILSPDRWTTCRTRLRWRF